MEKITFDQLPDMVALILDKLHRIEQILISENNGKDQLGKEMITVDEAAKLMGASKSYIYKLSFSRSIPVYKPSGRRVFFKKSDIINFLQQNRLMSQKEIEQEAINYIINGPSKKRKAERLDKK